MSMPEASPSSIPPRPADDLDEAEKTQPTQPFLTEDIEYDEDGFEEDAFSDDADAVEVIIPEGLKEGALFIALVGNEEFEVTVPPGLKGGDTLALDVPVSHMAGPEVDSHDAVPNGKKKIPKRQVSFTEEEPSVVLFRPELGGLGLTKQPETEEIETSPQIMHVLDIVIPPDVSPGDILEVESDAGEMIEVVVPEGMEPGMTLTVESPMSKQTQTDFRGAAPEQHNPPSEDGVQQETKKQTEADSSPMAAVEVSEDVFAGDVLEVESPEGERIEVVVPEDTETGKTLTVESPKSKQTLMDFGGAAREQDKVPSEEAVKQDTNPPEKPSDSPPLLSVVVPEDVFAGDVLEVESPEGERIEVVVPEDTEAGKTLTVESPKSKKTQIDFGGAAPEQDKVPSEEPVKLGTKERTQRDLPPEKPSDSPPLLSVVVPEDVFAGDVLEVESPEGERIEVVVPTDTEAGKTLTVESPVSKQTQIDFGGAAPEQDKVPSENQVGQGRSDKTNEAPLQTEILAESQQSKEAEMKPEETIFLKQDNPFAQEQTLQDGKGRSKQGFDSLKHSDFPTILAVLIPEGAVAGDLLQVEPDTGETVEVTVPRGMQAGMTMTVADLGSGWQPVTDRLGEVLQSGGDLEMSLLSHAEMDSILQPLPPQPLQSGLSEELLAVPNNSAIPGKSDRSAWRTLTQLGGGEVMKLRRWPESGLSVKSEEDPPQDSGKVEVAVQTESVDFTLYPIGLKAHPLSAWGGPALPPLPSCGLHCKMPLVQETTNGNISLVAMKLALESLQREKEDLERKLKESQKEVLRLELRDEDAIKAMEVRQNVLLRQENDEMRKIALAALRHREEGREVCRKKKGNKMERKSLEVKDTWLQAPPKQARVKRSEQVTVEDLETPSEAIASPVGHAGGSHGVRRIRSHSDSSVAEAKELSTKRKYGSAGSEKGELGQPVHASPCGSAKDPQASKHRSTKPVVRLKPKDTTITKYDPDPGSCRSSQSKTTWRVRAEAETDETGPGWSSSAVDARLATASIYTAAALSADTLGWGATAAAAQSVGIRKTRSEEARNAMMQPLNDTSEAALVCERAVSGAFVLESGQQEPDLRCADEFNESAAHHQNLAKEDVELRDFFAGSAYSSGSHLADCCPSYILVDDGSGVADAVPVYRHVKSGCLLLSFPVSLVSPDTPDEDIRLFFCRGPLPLMRRYGRGVLGCMEILFELFADTEGINGRTGSEFYGLCEGPGHETGETGSAESLCYLPILVDKQHVRSSPSWVDASKKHSQCFIKLPDMVASAGFAFGMMERRLKAEVYHSDGEGRAVRLLAHFFACLGRAEEAAVLWDQASQEDEAKLGSDHLQTASSFAALAACFDDLGRSEDAEAFHSKALAAMAKNFGRSSSEAVACELGLAACRHVQGKCKLHGMLPATQSGVLCLEGAAAHAIAVIFSQAAGDEREEAEAEVLYRQGLSILRRCLGPGHADTLHCLNNLALCMADQGKIQQAEQLLRRTVAGMEMVLAPTHPRPIQALSNLACCLAEQGKVEEAETNHRRAFENAKKRLGWQHPETSACAQSLAQFLTSCGRCTEAALLELQADQLGRPCWKRGRT